MAFTLAFHIILATLGVSWAAMALIANYRGIKHDDADALDARAAVVEVRGGDVRRRRGHRHRPVVRVRPAVADVHGPVGRRVRRPVRFEGIFFFTEAIFIAIYIFGWKRLSRWPHFWTGVPIAVSGVRGAFSVVAVNSWMNPLRDSPWTPPARSSTSTRWR